MRERPEANCRFLSRQIFGGVLQVTFGRNFQLDTRICEGNVRGCLAKTDPELRLGRPAQAVRCAQRGMAMEALLRWRPRPPLAPDFLATGERCRSLAGQVDTPLTPLKWAALTTNLYIPSA